MATHRSLRTIDLKQDIGRRLLNEALSPQAEQQVPWEIRLQSYLDGRPAHLKVPRSIRLKAAACRHRRRSSDPALGRGLQSASPKRTGTDVEVVQPSLDLPESDAPPRPTLTRITSDEAKKIAAPLAGFEAAGLQAGKNKHMHDFRNRQITRSELSRRNRELANEYNRYYANLIDGIKEKHERFGRLVPVTSTDLEERRSTMLSESDERWWTQGPSGTPRAAYRKAKTVRDRSATT
jgi:hypothetical protein